MQLGASAEHPVCREATSGSVVGVHGTQLPPSHRRPSPTDSEHSVSLVHGTHSPSTQIGVSPSHAQLSVVSVASGSSVVPVDDAGVCVSVPEPSVVASVPAAQSLRVLASSLPPQGL